MRRFILILSGILLFSAISAQYYVRGDHNGWGTSNPLLQRSTLYGGSTYATVFSASIDQQFKIANGDYSNQWGAGYWISAYNQRWTIGANGANAIWKGTPNTYIAVITENPANFVNNLIPTGIMTLSALPVDVTSVTQIGTLQSGNYQTSSTAAQTVNITLSSSKSAQENVYLRYTTNNWTSSNWVLATGSGTSYSASIPGQGNGTVISYYVLTTTLTYPNGDLDNYPNLMTLKYANNGGSNYSYTINISLATNVLLLEASKEGTNDVNINWLASNNKNIEFFELEYSQGKDFITLEKISAINPPENPNYSFKHYNAPNGTIYYRLKMIDKDGSYSCSKIVSVDIENQQTILLPNPNNGQFTLSGLPEGNSQIIIFDENGKLILETYSIHSHKELNIKSLNPGQYFVIIQNGSFKKSMTFQKY